MDQSSDKDGKIVRVGDTIEVLEVDERIYRWLDDDDRDSVMSFVGQKLEVQKINTDGSMVVTQYEKYGDIVDGQDLAIFPKGARVVSD